MVVSDTIFRHEGRIYVGEPRTGDDPLIVPPPGQDLGAGWVPIQQMSGPATDTADWAGTAPPENSAPS